VDTEVDAAQLIAKSVVTTHDGNKKKVILQKTGY